MAVTTVSLEVDGLEARECLYVHYQFNQQVDVEGQPTGTTRGGVITVKVKSTDSGNTELLDWTCASYESKNGKIKYPNKIGGTMKTIQFTDAYAVGYEEIFDGSDNNLMCEVVTITARQIVVNGKGSVQYDNHWAL